MNTVKCPNCGNENINTNIRCEKCGKQLINEVQTQDSSFDIPVQNAKRKLFEELFNGIGYTVFGTIISGFLFMVVLNGANNITKISAIPFLICSISVLIRGISMIIKGINTKKNIDDYVNEELNIDKVERSEKKYKKIETFVNNIYAFGFFLFLFGFLIVFDILAIKYQMLYFFFVSIIFWIVGIYVLINNFKKNK